MKSLEFSNPKNSRNNMKPDVFGYSGVRINITHDKMKTQGSKYS